MGELHFIQRPHDALFRAVFGDPDNAAEWWRCILPAAIIAAIDWRSLRRVEGSFVDDCLRDKHSEVLPACCSVGRRRLVAGWRHDRLCCRLPRERMQRMSCLVPG